MHLCGRIALCMGTVLLLASNVYGEKHPIRMAENSECQECHADQARGAHVHPAVKGGCDACHRVENVQDATYVVLKEEKGRICFGCHEAATFSYPHFPYTSGMCTRCHNPHASENAHLLRAQVNEICLQCHLRRADSIPSQYMPTITLVSENQVGHPYERHPVSKVRDPLTGGEMSCMSCHEAHGGTKLHLLKMGASIPEDALNQATETNDMCRKCHMRLWGLEGYSAGKKHTKK